MGIIEFDFNSLKDKIENSPSSPTLSVRPEKFQFLE